MSKTSARSATRKRGPSKIVSSGLKTAPDKGTVSAAPRADNKAVVMRAGRADAAIAPAIPGQPRVSLCMIVRNEESNLVACLGSVADLVNEIIVVDTGSTDRTKEVARSKGARVYDFPWADSFATARNESLRHATGEWIFWMDADDRIDEVNRERLRAVFASLPSDKNVAFLMQCVIVPAEGSPDTLRIVDHTRLFRSHPQIRWHYRVHEQILPALFSQGGEVRRTDVIIEHIGYQDPKSRPAKLERNLRLLQFDNAESPNDPFTLYNLGRALERMERMAEAIPYWRRSLMCVFPHETYVPKLYTLLAEGYSQLGKKTDMIQVCLAGLMRYPDHPELLFRAGTVLQELGDVPAAAAALERLVAQPAGSHFFLGDDAGIRYKAKTLLGRIYRDQQRLADAEAQWRSALDEEPNFAQAMLGLGQLFLDQGRWDELDQIIDRMESRPDGVMEAAVLRGLRHVARKEVAAAIKLMEETKDAFPKAVEPRILLSRILLGQRTNPAAAERVMREILTLEPNNVEARRNLAKLLPIQAPPVPQN